VSLKSDKNNENLYEDLRTFMTVFLLGCLSERAVERGHTVSTTAKAKFTLEQVTKAQRRSRGIALLVL
jgi:hypothetical protein